MADVKKGFIIATGEGRFAIILRLSGAAETKRDAPFGKLMSI
jgi:hypothetical protein